ncbi:hypothetical protein N177_1982 [Lutibaculum baratangense AMV1]|uniref:Uncharacterized protein n=1 Tax=Lutibaculum baratangense AMV1 TaxID=631454 RepID=V4TG59_9HYPH|nr:hypothetical protein N177_1982 [Lutibaculum baratangense AMV1]
MGEDHDVAQRENRIHAILGRGARVFVGHSAILSKCGPARPGARGAAWGQRHLSLLRGTGRSGFSGPDFPLKTVGGLSS